MALHMIRSTPTFTKAMRGYDIEEVDEYVDALRESEDEHAQVLEEAEAARRSLSAEVEGLRERIAELVACVRSETPRSIAALGERLTLVLEEAEAGAQDAVRSAREEADALLSTARATAEEERLMSLALRTDAEQRAEAARRSADEHAAQVEAEARRRADELIADAEQRALARRAEIEAWVERVRAHIENEEARAAQEFARVRAMRMADLADLRHRHDQIVAGMVEMGDALRRTVDSARSSVPAEPAAGPMVPATDEAPAAGAAGPYDDQATPGAADGHGEDVSATEMPADAVIVTLHDDAPAHEGTAPTAGAGYLSY